MLLKSSSSVHLRVCAVKHFAPDEYHVTRRWRYSVLILMQEGILRFYEDNTLIELHPGEYYIQQEGLLQEGLDKYGDPPHREGKPPVYIYLEFSGGDYADTGSGIPLRGKYTPDTLTPLATRCAELFTTPRQDPFSTTAYLYRILSELYTSAPERDPTEDTLEAVRHYLHSAYSSPLSAHTLAQQFGYHKDHLTRLFRRRYGITPGRYLRRIRMEHAHWQLCNTDRSIEYIALSVGYRDLSAFYRAFESIHGMPPGEVRTKKA